MIASTVTFEKDVIACVMNNQGMLDDTAGIVTGKHWGTASHHEVFPSHDT